MADKPFRVPLASAQNHFRSPKITTVSAQPPAPEAGTVRGVSKGVRRLGLGVQDAGAAESRLLGFVDKRPSRVRRAFWDAVMQDGVASRFREPRFRTRAYGSPMWP